MADYIPYSNKVHTGFQQSPAVECYTSQPLISDGLSNYSSRNQSEKSSKEFLRSKDKDWNPDADMESSDTNKG